MSMDFGAKYVALSVLRISEIGNANAAAAAIQTKLMQQQQQDYNNVRDRGIDITPAEIIAEAIHKFFQFELVYWGLLDFDPASASASSKTSSSGKGSKKSPSSSNSNVSVTTATHVPFKQLQDQIVVKLVAVLNEYKPSVVVVESQMEEFARRNFDMENFITGFLRGANIQVVPIISVTKFKIVTREWKAKTDAMLALDHNSELSKCKREILKNPQKHNPAHENVAVVAQRMLRRQQPLAVPVVEESFGGGGDENENDSGTTTDWSVSLPAHKNNATVRQQCSDDLNLKKLSVACVRSFIETTTTSTATVAAYSPGMGACNFVLVPRAMGEQFVSLTTQTEQVKCDDVCDSLLQAMWLVDTAVVGIATQTIAQELYKQQAWLANTVSASTASSLSCLSPLSLDHSDVIQFTLPLPPQQPATPPFTA